MDLSYYKKILFINPSVDSNSGLSRYYESFTSVLKMHGISVIEIQRNKNESIHCFKNRLHLDLDYEFLSQFDIIEIPQSYGLLNNIPSSCPVHVRLHGSDTVISELSGRRKKYYEEEKLCLSRGDFISAPSVLSLKMESMVFEQNISGYVFPNTNLDVMRREKPKSTSKIKNVGIASNISGLKGSYFMSKTIKSCPDITFYIFGKNFLGYIFTAMFKNVVLCEKLASLEDLYGDRINCFFIPSIYESYSMIAAEAFKFNKKVITFNSCGIVEQIRDVSDFKVIKCFDMESVIYALSGGIDYKNNFVLPFTYKECELSYLYSNKRDNYFEVFSSNEVNEYFKELADTIFSNGKFFARENLFFRLTRKTKKCIKLLKNCLSRFFSKLTNFINLKNLH